MSLLIRATAFVFSDPESQRLLQLIERVAPSDATALIIGETGTGKELVARHLHALSERSQGPFIAVNCGAFSETLVESELFGFERGAFTGAQTARAGWFEAADGGTLFLDEIGDLPLAMQVKLLRVLQEREVVRIGSRKPTPVDFRLIAATNVNLEEAVRVGRFRQDLLYRLQVVNLPVKPLRQRKGDILPLAQHFVKQYAGRIHIDGATLGPLAEKALLNYPWPGNIRELENVIHRALLVSHNGWINAVDLQLPDWRASDNPTTTSYEPLPPVASQPQPSHKPQSDHYAGYRFEIQQLLQAHHELDFEHMVEILVTEAYQHCDENQVHTARILGITRNVLRTHLKRSGLLGERQDECSDTEDLSLC
ncbi:sigma-54 dependent transcriptional regulator [Limnobacter thiooxidans]